MAKLYTSDSHLVEALNQVFSDTKEYKNVGKYMEEHGMEAFTTTAGQVVRKVSLREMAFSNYYKKKISDINYTIVGMPKYYCVEVYKDKDGKYRTWGIRYVDILKRKSKLYLKGNIVPKGYVEHITYLFPGDYIKVCTKKGVAFKGYYASVYAIQNNRFLGTEGNLSFQESGKVDFSLGPSTQKFEKYCINLLGQVMGRIKESGGEFPCFEPSLLKKDKVSG